MSGSKSVKGCSYVFKQGSKKDKRCNKSCRGNFCCDHKPKKIQYQIKYFQKKQQAKKEANLTDEVKKIMEMSIDSLPELDFVCKRKDRLSDEKKRLWKKLIGINVYLDIDQTKQIAIMEREHFGKCICKYMTVKNITSEQIEEAKDEPEVKCYCKTDQDIAEHLLNNFKCKDCDKYQINECRFCSRPIAKKVYFTYQGTSKEIAKKKAVKLRKKIDKIELKLKKWKAIKEVVENRLNEEKPAS